MVKVCKIYLSGKCVTEVAKKKDYDLKKVFKFRLSHQVSI